MKTSNLAEAVVRILLDADTKEYKHWYSHDPRMVATLVRYGYIIDDSKGFGAYIPTSRGQELLRELLPIAAQWEMITQEMGEVQSPQNLIPAVIDKLRTLPLVGSKLEFVELLVKIANLVGVVF